MLQSSLISRRFEKFLLCFLFFLYSGWIVLLNLYIEDTSHNWYVYFTDSYGLIAGIGGIIGLINSFKWGGVNSVVGRSILMFSLGLIFQFFGQISYAIVSHMYLEEIPYPSFGDFFYFLSTPFYIYGIWSIGIASGIKFELRKLSAKVIFILLMLVIVAASYYFFLSTFPFETTPPTIILLEFVYPIFQAVSVALALICYFLSKNLLGGIMKPSVLLLLGAFALQYLADTYFTYEYGHEMWHPAGASDYFYLIAYFVMSIAVFKFGDFPDKLYKTKLVNTK